jgi:hypothetical protein
MRKLLRSVLPLATVLMFVFAAFGQKAEMPALPERSGEKPFEEVDADDHLPTQFSASLINGTTYPFSTLGGVPLEDISDGATQILGGGLDDTASPVSPIGFAFVFDGEVHTEFSCNANGLCRLGPAAVTITFSNNLATTTASPKIAPFWDDLCTGTDGGVRYKVVGDAPNRKLVVDFFNMKITRSGGCAGAVGNGSFQMWLHETSGIIQFVYGPIAATTADGGYSIGMQAGVATNFASVTTAGATVSYDTANNTQMDAIVGGTSYLFTPVAPAAPTGLAFSEVTALGMKLTWADNATGEVGYAVFRDDELVATLPPDSTEFVDSGLSPSTSYDYRVHAFSEGAFSAATSGSQMTAPVGNVSAITSGLWSSPATWSGGAVPTLSDNVTIDSSTAVTVDVNAEAYSITIGNPPAFKTSKDRLGGTPVAGLLIDNTANRSVTVVTDITIHAGTSLTTTGAGTASHTVTLGGSITNNGVMDLSIPDVGVALVFVGSSDESLTGSGSVTDIHSITVNKGSNRSAILHITPTNFTVGGSNTDTALGNFLTIQNGTVHIGGTFEGSYRTFAGAASWTIPATGGFWLDNPNYTVVAQAGNGTNNGLLRVSQGEFNVGTESGNSLGGGAGGEWIIEGGTINTAGRMQTTSSVTVNISGGTINVCTVGNTLTTPCFGFTSTLSTFNMSGGVINLVQVSSGTTVTSRRAWSVNTNSVFTGGTVNVGTAATTGASGDFEMRMLGNAPNIVVNGDTNGKTMTLAGTLNVYGDILVESGASVNVHNGTTAQTLQFRGGSITNNGAINGGAVATSRVNFLGTDGDGGGIQSYSGSGEWGNATTPASGFGILGHVVLNAPIITNRVNLFGGFMQNSGNITLGNGGTSATVVQTSQTGSLINGGVFDVAPVFNTGSGGHTVLYAEQPDPRPTGLEVPPTREVAALTMLTPNGVVIEDGNLWVTGTLTLTAGTLYTGSNVLTHNGTVARTTGVVSGKLRREYMAPGTYTYHVADNGYSPLIANVTAVAAAGGGNPVSNALTVEAVDGFVGGFDTSKSISRSWDINKEGGVTADLSFVYTDDDVNGNEADYRVYRVAGGVVTNFCEAAPCVSVGTNTAGPATGVTDFSRWTVGELQTPTITNITLAGQIVRANGAPIGKVNVTLSGGGLAEPVTLFIGQMGYFRFRDLPPGGTYTITVNSKTFTFTPVQVSGDADILDIVITPNN